MSTQKQTPQSPTPTSRTQTTPDPGHPPASGYAEPLLSQATIRSKPNPDAAGNEASQVAAQLPAEEPEENGDVEPTPPGEHKREPIKDPDPADTKLHAKQSSH